MCFIFTYKKNNVLNSAVLKVQEFTRLPLYYRVNLSFANAAVRQLFMVLCFYSSYVSPDSRLALSLTSVGVIEVDKLLPFVVGEQAEDCTPEGGPHLDDKLHLVIGGVTGRDKGGVQSAAE